MEGGEVDDDEDSFAGEEEGVGGELEVDACGEGDAGEVDGGGGDVLEFDEFFEVVVGGVVVDFGDDEVGGGGGFGGGGVGDGDVVGAGGVALVVEGVRVRRLAPVRRGTWTSKVWASSQVRGSGLLVPAMIISLASIQAVPVRVTVELLWSKSFPLLLVMVRGIWVGS